MNDHLAALSPHFPDEDQAFPHEFPDEFDDDWPLELADDIFDALTPDDDYEPIPDPNDFWPDEDAA
jgi:hypothetical protein